MTTFTTDDRLNAESNTKKQVNKHTPGPWHTYAPDYSKGSCLGDDWTKIYREDGRAVAHAVMAQDDHGINLKELFANAHLIAAAPELLEALIQAVAWMDGERTPINALAHARSIIAKAKGEA